jgi:hypothetical protein
MKTLKDLRQLKKAKFERINTKPENLLDTLEKFKAHIYKLKPDHIKILEIREGGDYFEVISKMEVLILPIPLNSKDQKLEEKTFVNSYPKPSKAKIIWSQAKSIVDIEFRAGGDYIVIYNDGELKSYGDKLKTENLTEKGFKITTFDGTEIFYNLI